MAHERGGPRWAAVVVMAGLGLGGTGCLHNHPLGHPAPLVTVPPDGSVPRELDKVTLPEYVIEPPDVLRIEAVIRIPPGDKAPVGLVSSDALDDPKDKPKEPPPSLYPRLQALNPQPVFGEYPVRPDGTVYLGIWGSVRVAGLTISQASVAVREKVLGEVLRELGGIKRENLLVLLDVTQYNSKRYYIFFDSGAGNEVEIPLPLTGSETVLDALGNVNGLPNAASRRNIWVARRTPHAGQPEQILPVDWVGITQHGITQTNYQIFPGDRIYVKAQRIITIDTTLARLISPVERIFGVTLLGTSVVNGFRNNGTNTTNGQ